MSFARLGSILAAIAIGGCALLPAGQQAPPACGFADNTALVFAGRTTAAALGVPQDGSKELAEDTSDIYITRDEFDRDEGRGRIVCAIYDNGFTNVYLVPEAWDPETGGPLSESATAEPNEPEPVPQPDDALTETEAIAAAREAVPQMADLEIIDTLYGPASEILMPHETAEWRRAIPRDGWLWLISGVSAAYLEMTSFSLSGLIEQLEFEGFTPEQAAYGANAAYAE